MLIGAIVTIVALAVISSSLATIGNLAIAREFPQGTLDFSRDILPDSPAFVRFVQYRLLANLFYRQALALWALATLLLAYKALSLL